MDIYRDETTTLLVQKYQDISDILLSIEQLLFEGKAEGRNRELREYYSHWEKRIYRSLGKACSQYVTRSISISFTIATRLDFSFPCFCRVSFLREVAEDDHCIGIDEDFSDFP